MKRRSRITRSMSRSSTLECQIASINNLTQTKKGNTDEDKQTFVNTIAFLAFSTMLAAAQMHGAELDEVAGMKATTKGKVSGQTIAVQSVESAMKMK